MLVNLSIKNYALIRHLELQPSAGLNVVTGETGAGKSIILGALGLLLGNRADVKSLWNENEKCITEGTFDLSAYALRDLFEEENLDYENRTLIRREINPAGKSRAFINDTPVNLDVLRKIGTRLMDIHSQHETLELGKQQFQLELIDAYADNEKIRSAYELTWKKFNVAKKEYENLLSESKALQQEHDFVKFQLDELAKADLKEGEQEKLESELSLLEHAEEIKSRLTNVIQQLSHSEFSVTQSLSNIKSEFFSLAAISKEFEQLLHRIESVRIELNDILQETENVNEKSDYEPERAEKVNERLSIIYHLQQKHRVSSIAELLSLQNTLQEKANKFNNMDELLSGASKNLNAIQTQLLQQSKEVSNSRIKIFKPLSQQLISLLKELGIPDAQLMIDRLEIVPSFTGIDKIEILFSANKGIDPRPLAQVASGGEFSRVMFAIKYVMAERKSLPTLILDEIDSGVSGEVAIRLGKRMKEISSRHQIIAISHLPQIAAKADSHYFVFKDNSAAKTESQIKLLSKEERVMELAKMIGGANPSTVNIENARELMAH
ncbi:MAG TPA: DNA repair protein RecN [Cytophagales bacterium]|jgi:DNA repair protein RecN (Recombination protein N)|nr:DNA repair protein RecN [Cytophagales bacterium]